MSIRKTILATAAASTLLAAAVSVSGAAQFVAAPYAAAGASMKCSIPNHVVCTITSNKGIKSVKITTNTPWGVTYLWNKSYPTCPKTVTVHWDSAYHSSGKQIVECVPMGLKLAP